MSAVASAAEYTAVPAKPALEVVALSPAQMAEKEMYRWMLWFGLPSLVAAIFVGFVFATGSIWWIGGAISAVIAAISVLIWLAMTSSTEGN
jgi:membrane protein implicated in regulation of membrane protease activity